MSGIPSYAMEMETEELLRLEAVLGTAKDLVSHQQK
jgi:hypothetical protein